MNVSFDIIDYGYGNVASCSTMLSYLGVENNIITTTKDLSSKSIIILPGVGSYDACIKALKKKVSMIYSKIQ